MKKIIACFLVLVLSLSSASAAFEPTKRKNILKLMDTYIPRYKDACDIMGTEFHFQPITDEHSLPRKNKGGWMDITTHMGEIQYHSDLTVKQWKGLFLIIGSKTGENNNKRYMASCQAAISALEYDFSEEEIYGTKSKSVILKSNERIFNSIMDLLLNKKLLDVIIISGIEYKVTIGNYIYFLSAVERESDSAIMLYITAKQK